MTITELKQYIYENQKIEYILEQIDCHSIKYHKKGYWTCGNYDGDNPMAINIYNNENLVCLNHTRNIGYPSDLITLVCFNKNLSFVEGIKYLHKILGLKNSYKNYKNKKEQEKQDPLNIFKKIKRKRNSVNVDDLEIYGSSIIEEYEPILHVNWMKEGILKFTREKFNIGYSYKNKRIIIPHRYWAGEENDYLGVIGRTTIDSYSILNIPKYYPLKPFPKTVNLYGLQENYKSIQEAGYVCVYEGEKAVLKRHSRLDNTGVAACSHNLSDEQIKILLGLDVSIIICYDKDIPLEHIRSECERFFGLRSIYYIYDKWDLLKEKESPADASNKIFNFLFKYKVKYDKTERRKYFKWLEKQGKN